ncbi:UDP-N-acetylglucosamine 2-epimerase (non-hydrolyzing) [Candidatus Micrarchaeota archaeon]|nr:UDP-N-acetylglucosamine 2-epimerase (non-hydrolyzing) [Candidatus Micrarchaeota archaeon]
MIGIVVGTRPELVKMAPVLWRLDARRIPYALVHSGQHYDYNLNAVFFEDLHLRKPDVVLDSIGKTDASQTAGMMAALDPHFDRLGLSCVVVQGDTNTVLAASLVAKKQQRMLAHVEAGARSFDRRMPEEINRVSADHLSDLLFAPDDVCRQHLLDEGLPQSRIVLSGNTQFESLAFAADHAKAPAFDVPDDFILVTAHRQETNEKPALTRLVDLLRRLPGRKVFLVHPRTRQSLQRFGLWDALSAIPDVALHEPVGFLQTVWLIRRSSAVLTDSGGLQVEAAFLQKPVIIPRDVTEWPDLVQQGRAVLVGLTENSASKATAFLERFSPQAFATSGRAPSDVIVSALTDALG